VRRRLDNDRDKVRKVKAYNGNRRKRKPFQQKRYKNGYEDANDVEMEFDCPKERVFQ